MTAANEARAGGWWRACAMLLAVAAAGLAALLVVQLRSTSSTGPDDLTNAPGAMRAACRLLALVPLTGFSTADRSSIDRDRFDLAAYLAQLAADQQPAMANALSQQMTAAEQRFAVTYSGHSPSVLAALRAAQATCR